MRRAHRLTPISRATDLTGRAHRRVQGRSSALAGLGSGRVPFPTESTDRFRAFRKRNRNTPRLRGTSAPVL